MKNTNKLSKSVLGILVLVLIFVAQTGVAEAKFSLFKKDKGGAAAIDGIPATQTAAESCDSPIYARIKFSNNPNASFGVRNWGTGNLKKAVYVGGNAETDKYGNGEWFVIHNGTDPKIDADILAYEDVEGVAVQRLADSVRVVLHGSWDQPTSGYNKEKITASLEFSTDKKHRSQIITPYSLVSDTLNNIDFSPNHGVNDAQDDRMLIVNNQVNFKFVVTTNDDGFYAHYRNIKAGCEK